MVEHAGISKGALFKYFTSKEKLFLYICRYLAEKRKKWLEIEPDQLPKDFFAILRFFALRDFEYVIQMPMHYKFMDQITRDGTHCIYQKAIDVFKEIGDGMFIAIMSATPSEDLREGVSQKDAMNLITWVFNGFNETMRARVNGDFKQKKEEIISEIDKIFDLLKYGIYKR